MRNRVRPAKGAAAFMAVGMAAELLHGSVPEVRVPSDLAIATGQYACSLSIKDTHEPVRGVSGAAVRDRIIAHLKLTPQAAVADYTSIYPRGNDRPGHTWFSPTGTAFAKIPGAKGYTDVPGFPVLTISDNFSDKKSPTGDDLNPSFVIQPSENTLPGQRDEVYLSTRVLAPVSANPEDGTVQTEGYTPCGAIVHTGPLQWQVDTSAPEVQPFAHVEKLAAGN